MGSLDRRRNVRRFLFLEGLVFLVAALLHADVLIDGYEHVQARIAESVLASVLLIGLVLSQLRPTWTRVTGIAAQGFALFGTLIGMFTISAGVGPRTCSMSYINSALLLCCRGD